jgi:ATP-dependent DNA ligase
MGGRSDRTPLPSVEVMQPALIWRPFHREGWVYEEKYDGWRMVAYKYGKAPRFVTRAGADHTRRLPGFVAALQTLPAFSLILDGEMCRFDEQLVSRFEGLRRRPKDETAIPQVFMVFDCLYEGVAKDPASPYVSGRTLKWLKVKQPPLS